MRIPTLPGFDPEAFQKYLKNTGWLMMARVGSLFIKMVITSFAIPNYLGTEENGMLNYPMTIVTFFMAAAALGLDAYLTRELIHQPDKKDSLLGTAFILRSIAGLLVIPLVFLTYFALSPAIPFSYIAIASLCCIIQAVNIIDCYFQATVQAKYIMRVQVGGNIISALIKLLLIVFNAPLDYFIWCLVGDVAFIALGYVMSYTRRGFSLHAWSFESKLAKHLLQNSWPLAFSSILVTLYMKIDQIMIEHYLDNSQLGIYSPVVSLSESWYFIPVAISTSVFPALMNARREDPQRYKKRLSNLYDLMCVISISIAIATSVLAPYVFQWFYKPEYASGAPVLAVHVWAGVFAFLGTASGQYLIAEGYARLSMLRTAVGAVVNILLNILWIPRYGILGAAYATLIAYFVSTFFIILIPNTREQAFSMLKSVFLLNLFLKITKGKP